MIDASPVTAPGTREVSDLLSACARMDLWGWSEVTKAACRAVGTCIKSQRRPVYSCSRCAPCAGGGIDCALLEKKWNQQPSKRKQMDILESFFPVLSFIQTHLFFNNFQWIIYFSDITSIKDNLTNWSLSREKLSRIHRINTLALPFLQLDHYKRKTCPHFLDN